MTFLCSSPDMVVTTGTPLLSCEDENKAASNRGPCFLGSWHLPSHRTHLIYPSEVSEADFEGGSPSAGEWQLCDNPSTVASS